MSSLEQKINDGLTVVTAELTPPKGTDLSDIFAKAAALKGCVDAINLTESARALMAIAPTAVARLLRDRGVETIVQMTSRDRNRIAIQADLLGAAVLGIRNFVFMGGDPPTVGDHPEAKPVFDLTASQMLAAARDLTLGRDMSGKALKGVPQFVVGATVNPGAKDQAAEIANTWRKLEAGARFLQTQAIYDARSLQRFIAAVKPGNTAILAGIIPLKSVKMAMWLNEKVPGIEVPEALIQEMQSASGAEAEMEKGIEIAARLVREVTQICHGVHVMAIGAEAHIPAILDQSGLRRAGAAARPTLP
ncbi:MAG: methylenetetrahydrofolate reductase [Proteobacteria bacterium]|nr:methylenetetrahydrofolate reductase [Pseudomonadota bacterium]